MQQVSLADLAAIQPQHSDNGQPAGAATRLVTVL